MFENILELRPACEIILKNYFTCNHDIMRREHQILVKCHTTNAQFVVAQFVVNPLLVSYHDFDLEQALKVNY